MLYIQLLKLSPKEKTTRLILATLRNLLDANPTTLLPTAVLAKLPALLQNVAGRHLTDPELLEDLEHLKETLEEKVSLLAGDDQWRTAPVKRLGVSRMKTSDGPVGVRGGLFTDAVSAASLPTG